MNCGIDVYERQLKLFHFLVMIRSLRLCRILFSCHHNLYVLRLMSKHLLTSRSKYALCCKIFHKNYTTEASLELTTNNPRLRKYLEKLRTEYEELKLKNTELLNRDKKRQHDLAQVFVIQQQINDLRNSVKILDDLTPGLEDKELASIADEERAGYEQKIQALQAELLRALVPEDPAENSREMVLEVSAGVGGQEAMLFARELFNMYCAYAEYKGWQVQVAELEQSDLGGLRHASLLVCGDQVYQHLRHEAGVHRVQRVPVTEKFGRIHTSTVTVATLPQPEEVDICIKDKDLLIETKRASGAGGQHVNTTDSAVRVTHIPTGVVVECQVDRSQIKNKAMALQRLRAKLYQQQLEQQMAEIAATRKQQVGSRLRSEKIRTYNFNQDRVTDHRVGGTLHNLRGFLSGAEALDCLIHNLDDAEKASSLSRIIAD